MPCCDKSRLNRSICHGKGFDRPVQVAGLKQAVLGEMNPGPDPEIAVRPVRYVPRPMIASSSASGISL
jgi:hypothetical protein